MKNTVILIPRNGMGQAEPELMQKLFATYLRLLLEHPSPPGAICFYTDGVRLVCAGSKALLGLQLLHGVGVRLVVCQTCLEHYGLLGSVAVGEIGNMKQIAALMLAADKVLTV